MYEDNTQSRDYVATRLTHTAIIHKLKGLVWVVEVVPKRDGLVIRSTSCNPSVEGCDSDTLDAFDLTSPTLGYMNYEDEAYYIVRLPLRRDWRQGIRRENLAELRGGRVSRFPSDTLDPLAKQLKGSYPSYKESLDRVEDIFKTVAFSKHFAIDTQGRLHYKGTHVVGGDNNGTPVLSKKFSYLGEALEEEVVL